MPVLLLMLRPDWVTPRSSSRRINHRDAAVRTVERTQVEICGDGRALLIYALRTALPPVAAPRNPNGVDLARLDVQLVAIYEQFAQCWPLRGVIASGLYRVQQGIRIQLIAVHLNPATEA